MKTKLLVDASRYDRLAVKADRAAEEASGFWTRPIETVSYPREAREK